MAFEPTKHLRQLRGKGGASDYLDVKWRLVWLRDEHPDAAITTRVIEHDRQAGYALVQASVVIPNGGSAEAHGDEDRKDFADYLCKAETKALGRALAALGYGTQFVGDELDEGDRIADAPVERRPAPARPAPRQEPRPLRPTAPAAGAMPEQVEAVRDALAAKADRETPEGALAWLAGATDRDDLRAAHAKARQFVTSGMISRADVAKAYNEADSRLRAATA